MANATVVTVLVGAPIMLLSVAIGIAMRGWVWRILHEAAGRGDVGRQYASLNPDGWVFVFEFKLLRILSGPTSSVLSRRQVSLLRLYAISRLLGVVASLSIGFAKLSIG